MFRVVPAHSAARVMAKFDPLSVSLRVVARPHSIINNKLIDPPNPISPGREDDGSFYTSRERFRGTARFFVSFHPAVASSGWPSRSWPRAPRVRRSSRSEPNGATRIIVRAEGVARRRLFANSAKKDKKKKKNSRGFGTEGTRERWNDVVYAARDAAVFLFTRRRRHNVLSTCTCASMYICIHIHTLLLAVFVCIVRARVASV